MVPLAHQPQSAFVNRDACLSSTSRGRLANPNIAQQLLFKPAHTTPYRPYPDRLSCRIYGSGSCPMYCFPFEKALGVDTSSPDGASKQVRNSILEENRQVLASKKSCKDYCVTKQDTCQNLWSANNQVFLEYKGFLKHLSLPSLDRLCLKLMHYFCLASSICLLYSLDMPQEALASAEDTGRVLLAVGHEKVSNGPLIFVHEEGSSISGVTKSLTNKNETKDLNAKKSDLADVLMKSSTSGERIISSISENEVVCKESYDIFPCSVSLTGNLFLIVVYGYLLLTGARLISNGSELLLEVMNPGLLGGLLLPVLGALPDAALIVASGAGGTIEEARQDVFVGVGVLAGSTTLILTVAWAGSLIAGRCDLSEDGKAKELMLTRGFNLFKTGVTTDEQTRWGALVMMISGTPYICAQLPLLDGNPGEGPKSALAGSLLALAGFLAYSVYQVASPWLQRKRIEEARLQLLRSSALQGIASFPSTAVFPSSLIRQDGGISPSKGLLREIFTSFDRNRDGKIEEDELRGLIVGLNVDRGFIPDTRQVETWLTELDTDVDGKLTENEFLSGIKKWANQVTKQKESLTFQQIKDTFARNGEDFWATKLEEARETLNLLESEIEDGNDGSLDQDVNPALIGSSNLYQKASVYLICGAALATIFSDPLIDSIQGFSTASRIPPFFVAFVVVPFASNASELFSSILFARRRRKRNISLTYSQIYGSVTMNNTLCLGIFLAIVYARGLTWDFSSEVTVVLMNTVCVGLIGVSRTTFPLWYAIPVFSLYFVSLGGVTLLDNLLGWH